MGQTAWLFQGDNPSQWDLLKDHVPAKAKPKHHKALPYGDLPGFMVDLRERNSISARCLEFTILTAVRTSEAIGAQWSEIERFFAKLERRADATD